MYNPKEVNKRPTIADIARLCGVTAATVSRVLNDNANFSTSAVVRQKIRDAATQLGYMPDIGARNLSLRSSRVIGLFASPHTHIADGINEYVIEGVTETLHAAGYDVFFGFSRRRTSKNPVPFWRFDGAVLMQAPKPQAVAELDVRRVPYVCVNERMGSAAAFVLADEESGMRSIISHLVDLSHERIAYANAISYYFPHYCTEERHAWLLAAVQSENLSLVPGHDAPLNVHSITKFLRAAVLESCATAVIAYDHQIAFMIVAAAHEVGLRIPEDFSLVCFNDVFPTAIMSPPLTCVAVPGREMGRVAADFLLKDLLSPRPLTGQEIRVAEHLIVRKSTASPKS